MGLIVIFLFAFRMRTINRRSRAENFLKGRDRRFSLKDQCYGIAKLVR